MHRTSNEIVFVHVSKNVDFCSLSKEKMSQIDPQIILDALEKAENEAKAVEAKFMDKVKNYENLTVSEKLHFSKLSHSLERIPMEHTDIKVSSDSKLQSDSTCFMRIPFRNRDILKKRCILKLF